MPVRGCIRGASNCTGRRSLLRRARPRRIHMMLQQKTVYLRSKAILNLQSPPLHLSELGGVGRRNPGEYPRHSIDRSPPEIAHKREAKAVAAEKKKCVWAFGPPRIEIVSRYFYRVIFPIITNIFTYSFLFIIFRIYKLYLRYLPFQENINYISIDI